MNAGPRLVVVAGGPGAGKTTLLQELQREAGALPAADAPALLASFRFAAPVFELPPWREIYVQDAERDQTWDDAVAVHGRVVDWYTRLGLPLLAVPRGPVAQRADFVLDALDLAR